MVELVWQWVMAQELPVSVQDHTKEIGVNSYLPVSSINETSFFPFKLIATK